MEPTECSLPKSEAAWMSGIHMRTEDHPDWKKDVEKFKREINDIPDPSVGRIQELRDKIKRRTLLTKKAIRETAERIAARFFGAD